jgi:hypothetical protein
MINTSDNGSFTYGVDGLTIKSGGATYLSSYPHVCTIDIDTLHQIRILLRCIQQPVVAYDEDILTMVQSAVGYCGEKAAEIEALLPKHGVLEDGE